jgi:hypothetical protein
MSQRSLRQVLVVAFSLTLSGFAFARNPPALVKRQQAAAHATQSSGGYRDINWRFGSVPARSPRVLREAGGYRDINWRFGTAYQAVRMASQAVPSRWR